MAFGVKVKIHPVVLLQITSAYERRNPENDRVIGTLLGTADKTSLEITNCFYVPHKECEDRVEVTIQYAQEMYELNKKVSPDEKLVGWFATGNSIGSYSPHIHDYYARETKDPIHITLDTTLTTTDARATVKAYSSVPVGVPKGTSGSMFTRIPVEIIADQAEVTGLDLLHKTRLSKMRQVEPITDLAKISEGTLKLENMLDSVIKYVEGVLEGTEIPDNAVGRKLLDLVNSVPKMSEEEFESKINSGMRDLLMVIYLTQLTKTQLQLHEKLTSVSLNQLKEYQKIVPE
ncbi:eukaryotic translation initiation factor 3 subunit F-1 [Lepeophtheirus salmonis]|uniref:Eukaryotic translation initiation factor 3 subunit F n=2 Tax=Lepeophtheirus salmonis TaxID=72036 RepID=D3PG03_LEPSM|nr:eukaryotic translation initiation factor 3 subunit F-1-like [Lepeophtheirus salmonis]ADD24199.1 Eukaryotic translation initiation factor 3 subunit F-1 [Lepeophtheirus salmonis]ADD24529.1 Eukaryotic translation initiation factor 3 subunit F-1 [Lepeophtheirus salmonis]ADD38830.1 Eukaryotic translation initiation factor 3 subunit F-1 [Lepeophtheirus salmonis]